MRVGWHYFEFAEEMEEYDESPCPKCQGEGNVVAIRHRKPRNFIETMAPRIDRLYACTDCDHEWIEEWHVY